MTPAMNTRTPPIPARRKDSWTKRCFLHAIVLMLTSWLVRTGSMSCSWSFCARAVGSQNCKWPKKMKFSEDSASSFFFARRPGRDDEDREDGSGQDQQDARP